MSTERDASDDTDDEVERLKQQLKEQQYEIQALKETLQQDRPSDDEVVELVDQRLEEKQSSSTRRTFIKGAGILGGAAALGGSAGAATGGGSTQANLALSGPTQNTYRITDNLYGGPDSAKSELANELTDDDAGDRYHAEDTGAKYNWTGSAWDQLPVTAPSVNTDQGDITALDHPLAVTAGKNRHVDYIDLASGWTEVGDVTDSSVTNWAQPSIMTPPPGTPHAGTWYVFYEYEYNANGDFQIGVATSDTPEGPYGGATEPLISATGNSGDPDGQQVADPTVLYIPRLNNPWRMWFDMESGDAGGSSWTIGHAYASGDPTDPANWTKYDGDSDGVTDILIGTKHGTWRSGFTHSPEAFIWNGTVYVEFDAQSNDATHSGYAGGLAIASDSESIGTSLQELARLTDNSTSHAGGSIRIKEPLVVGNTVYTLLSYNGNAIIGTINPNTATVTPGPAFDFDSDSEYEKSISSWIIGGGVVYGVSSKAGRLYKNGVF